MPRRPTIERGPDTRINVGLHPVIHKIIAHQAIEECSSMREVVHRLLCVALGREDLIMRAPEDAASPASR